MFTFSPTYVHYAVLLLPLYTQRHLRLEINKWTKINKQLLHNVFPLPTAPFKDGFMVPYI